MYKLKHLPTGLYFQPRKHRGSNLSKKGKIYQTKNNGLSSALKDAEYYNDFETRTFRVDCQKNSQIHKLTKDILIWKEVSYNAMQLKTETRLKDWVVEYI